MEQHLLAPAGRSRAPGAATAGAWAMAPIVLTYVPFGLVVGAAVAGSDNPAAAWAGTWLIFGGAAHLAVLDVADQGSWVTAAAVGLLINTRLAAYAASMAPAWRSAPRRQRLAAAVMLSDAPWALAQERADRSRAFYLGAGTTLFIAWPLLVTLGMVTGRGLTALPVVTLLLPLTLGTVVASQLRSRPAAAAALSAVVVAVLTRDVAAGPALLLVGAVGAGVGLVVGRLP